ncbi:hypothetical protein LAUMK13_04095 [Mycobacterium innocens]|uniref:Uncharacterized protein n=1 Tax=Mycobacterium innocens TaxID=2341083 RepID=A0A498QG47_9MYCO|nr:hypothetical protein LAUMK13_04095 [Mycobacterium innocens]
MIYQIFDVRVGVVVRVNSYRAYRASARRLPVGATWSLTKRYRSIRRLVNGANVKVHRP